MSAYFFVWFVSVIGRILIESIKGVIRCDNIWKKNVVT